MSYLPSLFERRSPFAFSEIFDLLTEKETSNWGMLRVDVRETATGYTIKADLPGFQKNEINVSLANQMLTIAAEHQEKKEEKDGTYLLKERTYRSVQRSIPLSFSGSEENVSAEYKDGVLEINVKKSPEKQAKRVPVQ